MNRLFTRGRGAVIATVLAAAFLAAPAALAADVTDIGYVDQGAISTLPAFVLANRQYADFGQNLQKQFTEKAKHVSQAQQQQLGQEFQQQLADKQRQLFGPLFARAQVAIASIASSKNLSVIVDKRIVVFGGTDITQSVKDLLTSPGDPVPPVSTPAPSTVGFVDQTAIDAVPKVKAAQDDFLKFKNDEDKATSDKLKAAKTAADRDAIFKDYKKAIDDKTKTIIEPVVDQTRGVIADIAKKKNLILVVDRSNIIYGGQDITTDVTAAIK
jgi:outer membrane protein